MEPKPSKFDFGSLTVCAKLSKHSCSLLVICCKILNRQCYSPSILWFFFFKRVEHHFFYKSNNTSQKSLCICSLFKIFKYEKFNQHEFLLIDLTLKQNLPLLSYFFDSDTSILNSAQINDSITINKKFFICFMTEPSNKGEIYLLKTTLKRYKLYIHNYYAFIFNKVHIYINS